MKKGKFKGAILACSLLAFGAIVTTSTFGLTSCGQQEETPDNLYDTVTAFAIDNKEEFDSTKAGYAWYPEDADKELKLSFTGAEVNVLKAFQNGILTSSSSNKNVASVINNYVAPVAPGEATITLTFKAGAKILTQEVKVTVLKPVPQPTTKAATIKELIDTNYDEWLAARPQQDYTVTGKVVDWYRDDAPSKYGNFNLVDDKGNKILVYGATKSTSALTFNKNGTWTFTNPKNFLDKEGNAPCKIGDKVTLHTTLTAYKGTVQLNGVITKVEEGQEESGDTEVDPAVAEALKNATEISVKDLAAKKAAEKTTFYTVTGVVTEANSNDKYGNITIFDKATGDTLTAYGTAKDASVWSINAEDKTISFNNPEDFGTECLGKKFNVGDEVKFNAAVLQKYANIPNSIGISLQFVKKVTDKSDIKCKVNFEDGCNKYFETLAKTEFGFGEKITLTPKTGVAAEGKEIIVKINGQRINKTSEGKFEFAAEPIVKITVIEEDATKVGDVFVDAAGLQLTGSYSSFDEKDGFIDIAGLKFDFESVMKNGSGQIQMNKKSTFWVATPSSREIEKIVINGALTGWDSPAKGAILYTTFALDKPDHSFSTETSDSKVPETAIKSHFTADEKSFVVASNVEGAKTFAITHLASSGATYLDSIEVFYK